MPQPDAPLQPALTRRAALAGLAAGGLVGLGACRWGPPEEIDGASEQEEDADAALVRTAAADVLEVRDLADRTSRRHVGLSPALTPLVALHDAHLGVLGDAEQPAAPPVPGRSGPALTAVRKAEQRLQARLAEHAASATSGPLARALASMSAAVAQHLAVLPSPGRGPA